MSLEFVKYDQLSVLKKVLYAKSVYYRNCLKKGAYNEASCEKSFEKYVRHLLCNAQRSNAFKVFTLLSKFDEYSDKNIDLVQRQYDQMLCKGDTKFIDNLIEGCHKESYLDKKFPIKLFSELNLIDHQKPIKYIIKSLNLKHVDTSKLNKNGVISEIDIAKIAAYYNMPDLFEKSLNTVFDNEIDEAGLIGIAEAIADSSNYHLLTFILPAIIADIDNFEDFTLFDKCLAALPKKQEYKSYDSDYSGESQIPDVNNFILQSGQNILHLILESRNLSLLKHYKEKYLTTPQLQKAALTQHDQYGLLPIHYAADIYDGAFFDEISDMNGIKYTFHAKSWGNSTPLFVSLCSNNFDSNSAAYSLLKSGVEVSKSFNKYDYNKWKSKIESIDKLDKYPVLKMMKESMDKHPFIEVLYRPDYKEFSTAELLDVDAEDAAYMDYLNLQYLTDQKSNSDDSSGYWSSGSDSSHDRERELKTLEWCDRCQTTSFSGISSIMGLSADSTFADF